VGSTVAVEFDLEYGGVVALPIPEDVLIPPDTVDDEGAVPVPTTDEVVL
jgi:hypothetical protein